VHEEQRLATIISLAESYGFEKPMVLFLRNYFRAHRNMGSRDRKIVTQSVYSLFRLGKSLPSHTLSERIAAALFLCSKEADAFTSWCVQNHSSLPSENISSPLKEKIKVVQDKYPDFLPVDIFPFQKYLSPEINFEEYVLSLLNKPGIFIRTRKKFIKTILRELSEKNILFKPVEGTDTVEILSSARLEDLPSFQKGYFEIQDWSSQRTGNYFAPAAGSRWWDACSGSGGKSLLLHDKENSMEILATDSREKSLLNLKTRFAKAGIRSYRTKVLNLENEGLNSRERFDGVIVDAPCSGSGTWARSPERLSSFDEKLIDGYSEKQKKIVQNVLKNLKRNSPLIYITCSVFSKENEENVKYFSEKLGLQVETAAYIKGYSEGADTLFVSRLIGSNLG
jgi:16S rRNA (cytosine967-C5)-methyltransferase